jgi:hypothetical protein
MSLKNKIKHSVKHLLFSPLPFRVQLAVYLLGKYKLGKFRLRLSLDAVPYPHYAYGMLNAAIQAKALGLDAISALEFGVAGGNGVLAMQDLAEEIQKETGVKFKIYGFDSGSGLPTPSDFRDQEYFWPKGSFPMDVAALRKRLNQSELVLGDVRETVTTFFDAFAPPPIGFVAFDLDYYSSTKPAFNIFKNRQENYLPRVECYMDDVGSFEVLSASQGTGVLKAIADFNSESETKIYKKEQVSRFRHFKMGWNDCMYVHHNFNHSQYNTFVGESYNMKLDLEQ